MHLAKFIALIIFSPSDFSKIAPFSSYLIGQKSTNPAIDIASCSF